MTDAATPTPYDTHERDRMLQMLAQMADVGLTTGITIVSGGAVITGYLISPKEYFEKFGKMWKAASSAETLQNIGDSWASLGQDGPEGEDKTEVDAEEYHVLHLRGAQFVNGNFLAPDGGMLWRCRISGITAFALGKVGENTLTG